MGGAKDRGGERGKCIIVEDDDALRRLMVRCAVAEGFEVTEMSTAEGAWDMELDDVQLLLLDWQLPGRSGVELCRHLRKQPLGAGPMILMITARDAITDIEEALVSGADDYLLKPFSVDQLRVRLRLSYARFRMRATQPAQEERIEGALARLPTTTAAKLVSLGAVASGVAHDINNPLAYVLTNLGHVIDQLPKLPQANDVHGRVGELVRSLEEARGGAERVRRVARDLGLFLRVNEEAPEIVDVHQLLEACVSVAWNDIRHRAELTRDYGQLPPLSARPSQLGHALLNLLLNAVQSIQEGNARQHRVELTTYAGANGSAVIEIADSGANLAEHVQPHRFDPLFQKRDGAGAAGLGLAIAKQIVLEHGGTLDIEPRSGRGKCVRVVLPKADRRELEQAAASGRPMPVLSRAKVLIVDDEASVARALARLIGPDHDVQVESDGRAAIRRICSEDYDLVFCDIMMPDVTGMDVYDTVRSRRPGSERLLVFMTGGAFTARAHEFRKSVRNRFIDKPFDLSVIRSLLSHAELESRNPQRRLGGR
jgi:DNA-binding response OmpR family regulator